MGVHPNSNALTYRCVDVQPEEPDTKPSTPAALGEENLFRIIERPEVVDRVEGVPCLAIG